MDGYRFSLGITNADLRRAAFRVIDRTQDKPEHQILGTALALLSMCEATGTDIKHLLEIASRAAADVDGPFSSTIKAIKEYAKHEIGRHDG
tara:strand:+ start:5147 stop:5419 length:273 start_codon:yes stop_codon:yes gene_type:complete